jgi:hypothetical protein
MTVRKRKMYDDEEIARVSSKVSSQINTIVTEFLDTIRDTWPGKLIILHSGYNSLHVNFIDEPKLKKDFQNEENNDDIREESKIFDHSLINKIQFEVYDESNTREDAPPYNGTMGIFETDKKQDKFEKFIPKIATFFMKKPDQIFLLNEQDQVLQKSFKIWETLTPFENSKLKGQLPKLKLVLTGNKKESEILGEDVEARISFDF